MRSFLLASVLSAALALGSLPANAQAAVTMHRQETLYGTCCGQNGQNYNFTIRLKPDATVKDSDANPLIVLLLTCTDPRSAQTDSETCALQMLATDQDKGLLTGVAEITILPQH